MKAKKILFMSLLLVVLFPWYSHSQFVNTMHQEMVSNGEKKPVETISGPVKVDVNTSGKFSLQIPLMNVPQRDGKNFHFFYSQNYLTQANTFSK